MNACTYLKHDYCGIISIRGGQFSEIAEIL